MLDNDETDPWSLPNLRISALGGLFYEPYIDDPYYEPPEAVLDTSNITMHETDDEVPAEWMNYKAPFYDRRGTLVKANHTGPTTVLRLKEPIITPPPHTSWWGRLIRRDPVGVVTAVYCCPGRSEQRTQGEFITCVKYGHDPFGLEVTYF